MQVRFGPENNLAPPNCLSVLSNKSDGMLMVSPGPIPLMECIMQKMHYY